MALRFLPAAWWPTPVLAVEHIDSDHFNRALAAIILDAERRFAAESRPTPVAGLDRGLTIHWKQYNVLKWPHTECERLKTIFLAAVRTYFSQFCDPDDPAYKILGIACWANVLRHGDGMHVHHHDQAFVNAHYFVQAGDVTASPAHPDSGHTVYYRPGFFERSHGERLGGVINPWDEGWRLSVPPQQGHFMFFPGYVRHEVRPYLGEGERVSIAFDVYVAKQEPLIYFGGPEWLVPD
jgi:hypothetical protein